MSKQRKGFTLLELLIVIVLLGILASIIIGNFFTSLKKGRDARRKADLEQIQRGLEMYYEDLRSYPASISAGESLRDPGSGKFYMQKVPGDPVGNSTYGYETGAGGDYNYFKLYSCLENDQQVLNEEANPTDFTCKYNCKDSSGNTISCIWGITSPNVTP